jgi:hypothetical protein
MYKLGCPLKWIFGISRKSDFLELVYTSAELHGIPSAKFSRIPGNFREKLNGIPKVKLVLYGN